MPLSTSAAVATVLSRPYIAVVRLLKIEFATPSGKTLYLSDAPRVKLGGQEWLPYVQGWGSIQADPSLLDYGDRPATATLTLFNDKPILGKPRVSALIRTPLNLVGTWDWGFAKVSVIYTADDLDEPIRTEIFRLEQPVEVGRPLLTVTMSAPDLAIENKAVIGTVTTVRFPSADPDDVGKPLRPPVGLLKDIPCVAIVAGVETTIVDAFTASTPKVGDTFRVTDGSLVTAGMIMGLDDEQVRVASCSLVAGFWQAVMGVRGLNGTTPAPHGVGAPLWEARFGPQAFTYTPGAHLLPFKVGGLSNIKVDGVLQPQATVDLNDTRFGAALPVINFPAKPVLRRQTVIAVNDQIAVVDTIGVSSPSTSSVHQFTGGLPRVLTLQGNHPLFSITVAPGAVTGYAGTPVSHRVSFNVARLDANATYRIAANGTVLASGDLRPGVLDLSFQASNAGAITLTMTCTALPAGALVGVIWNAWDVDVPIIVQVARSGAAAKAGTVTATGNSAADTVIGGLVTCDIEGIQDDDTGTVTGTPHLTLRTPTDVMKALLLAGYRGGPVIGDFDAAMWAAARQLQQNAGLIWDFMLEPLRFSDWKAKAEAQSRTDYFFEAGQWRARYRKLGIEQQQRFFGVEFPPPDGLGLNAQQRLRVGVIGFDPLPPSVAVADTIVDYNRDVWEQSPGTPAFSDITRVRNSLTVYAARDYRKTGALGDRYTLVIPKKDLTWVTDEIPDVVELDLVADVATAYNLANYELLRLYRQRLQLLKCVVWQNGLAVMRGDLIAFKNHPLIADFGGQALIFRVVPKEYQLAATNPTRISLGLQEINNP